MSRMLCCCFILLEVMLVNVGCQESTPQESAKEDLLAKLRGLSKSGESQLQQAEKSSKQIQGKLWKLRDKMIKVDVQFGWIEKNHKEFQERYRDFAHGVSKLVGHYQELGMELQRIEKTYAKALGNYKKAQRTHAASSKAFKKSESLFQEALVYWKLRKDLKKIAKQLSEIKENFDRANKAYALFKKGKIMKSSFVRQFKQHVARGDWKQALQVMACMNITPRKYRLLLKAQGMDLTGKDIDHIVPLSKGGAQHPLNYRVLDASKNRSLQATWNIKKCLDAGKSNCLQAILVSKYCGSYKGNLPPF
ncbi:MAG TPA: hypothetical protein DCE42_22670 [Myxococcales bacterium]|nr:hypothetical protein [Deltaproteobacteria bacterium]HAA57588.1 hypothetical protein [Myxococcales bacterium]